MRRLSWALLFVLVYNRFGREMTNWFFIYFYLASKHLTKITFRSCVSWVVIVLLNAHHISLHNQCHRRTCSSRVALMSSKRDWRCREVCSSVVIQLQAPGDDPLFFVVDRNFMFSRKLWKYEAQTFDRSRVISIKCSLDENMDLLKFTNE